WVSAGGEPIGRKPRSRTRAQIKVSDNAAQRHTLHYRSGASTPTSIVDDLLLTVSNRLWKGSRPRISARSLPSEATARPNRHGLSNVRAAMPMPVSARAQGAPPNLFRPRDA